MTDPQSKETVVPQTWTLGPFYITSELRWVRRRDATGQPYRVLQQCWRRYWLSNESPYNKDPQDEWRDLPVVEDERGKERTIHDHVWMLDPEGAGGAICKCGARAHEWYCQTSPDHLCKYSKSFDSCDYCGHPEERK